MSKILAASALIALLGLAACQSPTSGAQSAAPNAQSSTGTGTAVGGQENQPPG